MCVFVAKQTTRKTIYIYLFKCALRTMMRKGNEDDKSCIYKALLLGKRLCLLIGRRRRRRRNWVDDYVRAR